MLVKNLYINKNRNSSWSITQNSFSAQTKKYMFINSFLSNSNTDKKVLYIHNPFCLEKCLYCKFASKKTNCRDQSFISFYNELLPEQINEYKEIFENITFDQVYLGGGTPTLASAKLLESIFDKIPNFTQIPCKCMEASPHTLTTEHVQLLKKYDFTYLSIGIQSLNKLVCQKQNRLYLSYVELKKISNYLLSNSIYFNYDLIAFLDKGDIRDLKIFENDLALVLSCSPSCVTIHQCHQTNFSIERTNELLNSINKVLADYKQYVFQGRPENIEMIEIDTKRQAEYRLLKKQPKYYHYMWNKYPYMPQPGYSILSIGYTDEFPTISNTNKFCYNAARNIFF